jgi:UPF0042 nucleotide-binding protein
MSFGHRYGVPKADIVSSVQKLPNPYCISYLRNLTGLDKDISDYVVSSRKGKKFIQKTLEYINKELRDKSNITIAIGCVGGKHRSVAIVCELARLLEDGNREITLLHRDIEKY